MMVEDTISAVATAPGEGGIGIIRLSGPQAIAIADKLFSGSSGKTAGNMLSYQAAYGHIVDPQTEDIIDEVLLLVMRGPRSYTREDVAEIQCHGGSVPLRKILDLTLCHGARLAEAGEFTKRAFLNGRIDLSQAEAVCDVIRAKTDLSLKMAVGHLSGAFSKQVQAMRTDILELIAHLEASIDFPEEDIEEVALSRVREVTQKLGTEVDRLLATASTGRILRDGLRTAIVGKPNVGKSSLLNALVKENRAIVTDIPGTTRDTIEEYVSIQGIPLQVIDTAGIRQTSDVVEQIGVEKAKQAIAQADLVLLLLDRSAPLTEEDRDVLALLAGRQAIVLVNKSDLPSVWDVSAIHELAGSHQIIDLSVKAGHGVDELEAAVVRMVYSGQVHQAEGVFVNNLRHAAILRAVRQHLTDAQRTMDANMPPDCVVIDLRAVWEKLGQITGETVDDDIVDQIFSQFCIGK